MCLLKRMFQHYTSTLNTKKNGYKKDDFLLIFFFTYRYTFTRLNICKLIYTNLVYCVPWAPFLVTECEVYICCSCASRSWQAENEYHN